MFASLAELAKIDLVNNHYRRAIFLPLAIIMPPMWSSWKLGLTLCIAVCVAVPMGAVIAGALAAALAFTLSLLGVNAESSRTVLWVLLASIIIPLMIAEAVPGTLKRMRAD